MKVLLALAAIGAASLAGCADLDDLPACDHNAPPTLAVEGWRYWQDNSIIVKELVEKGWRNIQRGSSEGIYAECHASAQWASAKEGGGP